MKDQADTFTVELFPDTLCPVCSSPLPESKTRQFSFCTSACKQSDYRRRKKASRIATDSPKFLRISKKIQIKIEVVEQYIGISGTVHQLPIYSTYPVMASPVIKSFSDLKAFFDSAAADDDEDAAARYVTEKSPLTITSGLLSRGDLNHD